MEAVTQLRFLSPKQRANVLNGVEQLRTYDPKSITRNRKPMRPNPLAPWELRIQNLRVYYDVEERPKRLVHIRAIGIKKREAIYIGGEEVKL